MTASSPPVLQTEQTGVGHTPGPWTSEGDAVLATLPNRAVVEIALVNPLQELRTDAEYANARLIAAAPEMYEALENILSDADVALSRPDYEAARAAVAKARGQ